MLLVQFACLVAEVLSPQFSKLVNGRAVNLTFDLDMPFLVFEGWMLIWNRNAGFNHCRRRLDCLGADTSKRLVESSLFG